MDEPVRRRLAAVVVCGAVLLGLLLAVRVASSGPVLDWSAHERSGQLNGPPDERPQTSRQCPDGARTCERKDEAEHRDYSLLFNIVLGALGLLLLAGIVALLRAGTWPRLFRRRNMALSPPGEPLPDVAAAVREDTDRLRDTLRTGTPRNAIVDCWIRLEDTVMTAGVTVRGSDTSSELTARVLARHGVDPEAIRSLAALYREARFSRHAITEAMRERALDALGRVHDSLSAKVGQ